MDLLLSKYVLVSIVRFCGVLEKGEKRLTNVNRVTAHNDALGVIRGGSRGILCPE